MDLQWLFYFLLIILKNRNTNPYLIPFFGKKFQKKKKKKKLKSCIKRYDRIKKQLNTNYLLKKAINYGNCNCSNAVDKKIL